MENTASEPRPLGSRRRIFRVKNLLDKVTEVDWPVSQNEMTIGDLRQSHPQFALVPLVYDGKLLENSQLLSSLICPLELVVDEDGNESAVVISEDAQAKDFAFSSSLAEGNHMIYAFFKPDGPVGDLDPIASAKDWDARNRLKFFCGIDALARRKFADAADLLIEALPTFTEVHFMPFARCVRYAVLAALVAADRSCLGRLLKKTPEVAEVRAELGLAGDLLEALYGCFYGRFLETLALLQEELERDDWLMSRHAVFFSRELRIRVYRQVLQSYKSLKLESMASAFQVSREFIERYS